MEYEAAVFGFAALAAVALMVGYRTRVATVLCWVLHFSLLDRNPLFLIGGDFMLRVLLFWSMFVPLGACWSWDSRRRPPPAGAALPRLMVSIPIAALFLQVFSVYFFTGILKLEYKTWLKGDALFLALGSRYHRNTPLGDWLVAYPDICKVLNHATLLAEIGAPLLLFVPWRRGPMRTLAVLSGIGLQIGIAACMRIGNFQWSTMLLFIPLLPAWFWDRFLPAFVGGRAGSTSPVENAVAPQWRGNRFVDVGVGFLAAYTLVLNIASLFAHSGSSVSLPGRVEHLGYVLGIDQEWTLFGLREGRQRTGWTVVPATLKDGSVIDLGTGRGTDLFERPANLPAYYRNWRWRELYLRLPTSRFDAHRDDFMDSLRRDWNAEHPPERQIQKLEVINMIDYFYPNGEYSGPEPVPIWPVMNQKQGERR